MPGLLQTLAFSFFLANGLPVPARGSADTSVSGKLGALKDGVGSAILDLLSKDQSLDPQFEHETELEPINTDKLQARLSSQALSDWTHKLWTAANESSVDLGHPTRYVGTKGHNATLRLITDTLDELSDFYTYEVQPFIVLAGQVHNWTLQTSDGQPIDSKPLRMTPAASVDTAQVHFSKNYGCLPSDYTAGADQRHDHSSDGKIVVVKRGKCPLGEKVEFAGMAGAVGVLIWDPELDAGEVFSHGDLGTPLSHQVATLGISGKTAAALREHDNLMLDVDAEIIEVASANIIAETKGGDHENVVFAGAHSDSVLAGPGINDNGSGMITLLEVAKQLANFKVNNAVRLAWWSAEELGLKGSLYYTENLPSSASKKIRLFLDYDMLASRNYKYEIYDSDDAENPSGSSALRDMYIDWYKSHGYNYTLQPFDGRSDYVGFVELGIPSSGVDSGVEEIKTEREVEEFGGKAGLAYDSCYHEACDDLNNVSLEPWLVNTKLVAHSIAVYAKDLSGFPHRSKAYYQQRETPPRRWKGDELI